jgi:hypothetical protein
MKQLFLDIKLLLLQKPICIYRSLGDNSSVYSTPSIQDKTYCFTLSLILIYFCQFFIVFIQDNGTLLKTTMTDFILKGSEIPECEMKFVSFTVKIFLIT